MFKYDKICQKFILNLGFLKLSITLSLAKFLRKNCLFLLQVLDYIIPKYKDKIVFNSVPDFSDNVYVFYNYLKNHHTDKYKLIWITDLPHEAKYTQNTYNINSLIALYHIFTSKYIITCHCNEIIDLLFLNSIKNKRHIHLNLWHGMPLKTIGFNEDTIFKERLARYEYFGKGSYMFATSDLFKLSMLSSFNGIYKNTFITGQPRTDEIWSERNNKTIEKMFNFNDYDKAIFYMPTFKIKQAAFANQVEADYDNIFYMNDYNEQEFIDDLEKNNILFIMKPHPFDESFYKENLNTLPKSNNFKIVFNEDFEQSNIYSYEIFKYIDIMISDFSSVTLDYLILNRPVIYLTNLTEEYNKNRGMILTDNTEIFMPGAKVNSFKELLYEIKNNLDADTYKSQREKTLPLIHKYCDNKACERVYEVMKGL